MEGARPEFPAPTPSNDQLTIRRTTGKAPSCVAASDNKLLILLDARGSARRAHSRLTGATVTDRVNRY
jgi:hypothetical protein